MMSPTRYKVSQRVRRKKSRNSVIRQSREPKWTSDSQTVLNTSVAISILQVGWTARRLARCLYAFFAVNRTTHCIHLNFFLQTGVLPKHAAGRSFGGSTGARNSGVRGRG